MLLGDFNAKVGSVKVEDTIGPYGIGSRNDRGDRLVEWCLEHDLAVGLMNTWFQHHKPMDMEILRRLCKKPDRFYHH